MTSEPYYWFGRRPPATIELAWGARAIYTPPSGGRDPHIDILWDRQAWRGDLAARPALSDWINTKGLPAIVKACKDAALAGDSAEVVSWIDGNQTIEACPNVSYGYLYLVAYETCAICLLPHATKQCADAFEIKAEATQEKSR